MTETFYDAVGGTDTFHRLIAAFYRRVAVDPILRPLYPEEDLGPAEDRFRMFLEQYWGGPRTYSEQRGHPRLRMRHAPFAVTPTARDRWLECMRGALDEIALAPDRDQEIWTYLVMAAHSMVNSGEPEHPAGIDITETPLITQPEENRMAATRTAKAHWEGSLLEGAGQVALESSGLGTYDVTWAARTEESNGKTSPEELIAAAHSTCYSMSLSHALAGAGNAPTSIDTAAHVTFKPGEGITGIKLEVAGVVPGLTADEFAEFAEGAKENCPVSQALKGTTITLDVTFSA